MASSIGWTQEARQPSIASLADIYARSDPTAAGQIAQAWGFNPLFLQPADGAAAAAHPLHFVPHATIDSSQLERDLFRAVAQRAELCEPLHQLSAWFAALPADDQLAVSRVLQGATGRLQVQRRKTQPVYVEVAAGGKPKPAPLADRTNRLGHAGPKVPASLAAKKKGGGGGKDLEMLVDSPARTPWYRPVHTGSGYPKKQSPVGRKSGAAGTHTVLING